MVEPAPVVLDGLHAVKHALRFGARLRDLVALDPPAAARTARGLAPDVARVLAAARKADEGELRAMTGGRHPTGVAGLADRPVGAASPRERAHRSSPCVLLEDPRHAGNAGAVVRVAAAVGASGVLTTGALDPWGPAAVRGAAGLQFALPVEQVASLDVVEGPLVVLDPDGEPFQPTALPRDAVLAFGTERDGVSEELAGRADLRVALPMREGVSSLNLATSVSAVLYSWRLATE